jgi:hypothetical protein
MAVPADVIGGSLALNACYILFLFHTQAISFIALLASPPDSTHSHTQQRTWSSGMS